MSTELKNPDLTFFTDSVKLPSLFECHSFLGDVSSISKLLIQLKSNWNIFQRAWSSKTTGKVDGHEPAKLRIIREISIHVGLSAWTNSWILKRDAFLLCLFDRFKPYPQIIRHQYAITRLQHDEWQAGGGTFHRMCENWIHVYLHFPLTKALNWWK